VNILRNDSDSDLTRAVKAVGDARKTADLVVVSLHWGDEYRTIPTPWQRKVAGVLIEAGAEIILGHHPHVLQPVESYASRDGRRGLIAYSLGNFISSQNYGVSNQNRTHAKALRGDGFILNIVVTKEHGKVSVRRAEFLPIWTHRDMTGKTTLYRPVSLDREIARIEKIATRTKEQDNTLKLLKFRKKVITDTLTVKTAQ
jgi:poly-gamma-glutamate synthesis protein (capsule biosynthesis protein)